MQYVYRSSKWMWQWIDKILYCGNDIKGDLDHSKMAVCYSTTNNFWTAWKIFMKFGKDVMIFKGTSMQ
jgi:hypothetical protein